MLQKKLSRPFESLPSETLCSILKFALQDIIDDDMMTTAEAKHRVIAGGLPFPHTMASVCRQWRDVVSSAPELWTRIFCVMPHKRRHQTLTSQLQKSHGHPVLDIDHKVAHSLDHQWLKDNLGNVESYELPCYGPSYIADHHVPRALNAVPGRIPCLTIDGLQFPFQTISNINREGLTIGAEKVIVRECMKVLDIVDEYCKTIVIRDCEFAEDPRTRRLPSSNTLEFDGCFGGSLEMAPLNPSWDGGTAIFVLLGAPFKDSTCSLWPRVTTLKLVAKGDFVLKFPFKMLKTMISSRREAAGQENLGKNDIELDAIRFKGVRPIMVLHVYGGQGLLREEREWFKEQVRDFVWDS
ncbi:hypothetical protein EDD22DRAFT_874189 [Suillus occidentalis]|nr:hypothetical protein EDD22DRAFT_874189 [Suillus occidentalis]